MTSVLVRDQIPRDHLHTGAYLGHEGRMYEVDYQDQYVLYMIDCVTLEPLHRYLNVVQMHWTLIRPGLPAF